MIQSVNPHLKLVTNEISKNIICIKSRPQQQQECRFSTNWLATALSAKKSNTINSKHVNICEEIQITDMNNK